MIKRRVFFVLLVIGMVLLVSSCEEASQDSTNEINADWVDDATEWTDSNDSQLSYVDDGTDIFIDLGWYEETVPPNTDWIMEYIDEYTYSEGVLTGKYTSFENPDLSEYAITITFSYAAPTLTAVVVADGVLGNKTLNLIAAP